MKKPTLTTISSLVFLMMQIMLGAANYSAPQKDNTGEEYDGGIKYCMSVVTSDLAGLPSGYTFDKTKSITKSPAEVRAKYDGDNATGELLYDKDSLPSKDFTIAMSGYLLPPKGESGGTQPTWSARWNAKVPFLITSDISKIIWLDGTATFSTNLDADWYVSGMKLHTGKTFTIGKDWNPIFAEVYAITAKNKENNAEIKTVTLTTVEVTAESVDASAPASAKISYKLLPDTISCNAKFTVNKYESNKSVKDSFAFSFNQAVLITNTKILLELSNDELDKKEIIVNLSCSNNTKSDSIKNAIAYFPEDSIGTRFFNWTAIITYIAYSYDIPTTPKSLLLSFKTQVAPAYTATATGSPVSTVPGDPTFTLSFDNTTYTTRSLSPIASGLGGASAAVNFDSFLTKPISSSFKIYARAGLTAGGFTGGDNISIICN